MPCASPHLGHIVNERHAKRIVGLLDDALDKGAGLLAGGQHQTDRQFVAPSLIDNISPDAKIMQEEIFGPLMPVIAYRDLDEVITKINDQPKPLALYIWTKNHKAADKVLRETSSGGACITHSVVQFLHGRLPFGCVNNSGLGSRNKPFHVRRNRHCQVSRIPWTARWTSAFFGSRNVKESLIALATMRDFSSGVRFKWWGSLPVDTRLTSVHVMESITLTLASSEFSTNRG